MSDKILQEVVEKVVNEVKRAQGIYSEWPTDPIHALAILGEELGELNEAYGKFNKRLLQEVYEPHKNSVGEVETEATHTAAMAVRWLISFHRYKFAKSEQHEQ